MAFSRKGGAAVTEGGALWTWGSNKHVLGLGGKVASVPVPRPVKALAGTTIVDIALGDDHGAAVSDAGLLFTWGYGGFPFWKQGALGHGDRVDQPEPALVEAFRESQTGPGREGFAGGKQAPGAVGDEVPGSSSRGDKGSRGGQRRFIPFPSLLEPRPL